MPKLEHRVQAATGTETWRVRYRIDGTQKSETFEREADAQAFADLIDALGARRAIEYRRQESATAATPTLDDWAERYLAALTGVTEGTRRTYVRMYRKVWRPLLGSHPMDAIGRETIQLAIAKLDPGWSDKTVRNPHGLLAALRVYVHVTDTPEIPRTPGRDPVDRLVTPAAHRGPHLPISGRWGRFGVFPTPDSAGLYRLPMPSTAPQTSRFRYVPALDGLRAAAVLVVMAQHAGAISAGQVGVYLFFSLSGFLITSLLLFELARTDRIALGRFWGRRALRLFPALLGAVVIVSAYVWLVNDAVREGDTKAGTVPVLAYFANWWRIAGGDDALGLYKHMWSLALEEQFYVLWPLVVLGAWALTRRASTIAWVALAGAGLSALVVVTAPADSYARIYNGLDTNAVHLLLGCALAVAVQCWRATDRLLRLRTGLAVAFWPAVLVIAGAALVTPDQADNVTARALFLALAACSAVVVGYVYLTPAGWIGRLLALRPLVAIGQRSYGLYIWHYPVFVVVRESEWFGSAPGRLAVQLAATFAIAWLSYALLERPCLRLKDRLAAPTALPQPAPAAA